jgi:2-methylcitrate dehydratase PrpD
MADLYESATMLEDTHITDKLVSFAVGTAAADLPPATLEAGKYLIVDTIGVALAASSRPIGRIISKYVASATGMPPTATVLGRGMKASPAMAAMANGTMANALDFDAGGHSPTIIVPAALAVAEDQALSGRDVLTAFIVAFEAITRLTSVIEAKRRSSGEGGPSPTRRGWWHVGLTGPIGSAITASRLLRQSKEQMATAIGIATCSSGGFRRNMGTMAKALHSGNASRAGIEAALLAAEGFTADREILEAPLGFIAAVSPAGERDTAAIASLASPYALEKSPGVKPYPSVTPSHALIDTALAIRSREHFSLDEIDTIKAHFTPVSLFRTQVTDEESAGFCGSFLLALAFVHGAVDLAHYSENTLHDPQIAALMKRIVDVSPSELQGNKVVVRLRDGRELTAEAGRNRIVDTNAILKKFDDAAAPVLGQRAAETVKQQVLEIERLPNIKNLMAACAGS